MKKILLVDDNELNIKVLEILVKSNIIDIDISIAYNGLKAVEICEKTKFDLIFMDCQMPVMNGSESTQKIRLSELNCTTPICFVSANNTQMAKEMAKNAGGNEFLVKPVFRNDIDIIIEKDLN